MVYPSLNPFYCPVQLPFSGFRLKDYDAHGREIKLRRLLLAMARNILRGDAAVISLVAAGVNRRVTVQHLAPLAGARQADAIIFARHGCEIQNDDERVRAVGVLTRERQHAALAVVAID